MTEQEEIEEFNEKWVFGEPQSPIFEKTSAGKFWKQGDVGLGGTVIVRTNTGYRSAKLTGLNSFGVAKVLFEGEPEVRLHYRQLGRYVTPELTEGELFTRNGKFYVVRKVTSGAQVQFVLLRCEADGSPAPRARPLQYFDIKKYDKVEKTIDTV